MDKTTALQTAKAIANLLRVNAEGIIRKPYDELGHFARASVERACTARDKEAFSPALSEILIFGPLAQDQSEVNSIRMMVLDTGFYSAEFLKKPEMCRFSAKETVKANLMRMMSNWFDFPDYGYTEREIRDVTSAPVELLVLPTRFLTLPEIRSRIVEAQEDPHFFQDAFGTMLRFDFETGEFVPVFIEYFEEVYGAHLSVFTRTIDIE